MRLFSFSLRRDPVQCTSVYITSSSPQECAWGAQDPKGRPVGTGCQICVGAVVKGACMGWEDGMNAYHDSAHPEHAKTVAIVDACCNTLLEHEKGKDVHFTPPSSVDSQKRQGVMNFMDVAFMSDADLIRYTGLGWKALGLTPVSRENEDGCGTTQGIYISLKDLDLDLPEVMSLRKTRFWSEAHVCDCDKKKRWCDSP